MRNISKASGTVVELKNRDFSDIKGFPNFRKWRLPRTIKGLHLLLGTRSVPRPVHPVRKGLKHRKNNSRQSWFRF